MKPRAGQSRRRLCLTGAVVLALAQVSSSRAAEDRSTSERIGPAVVTATSDAARPPRTPDLTRGVRVFVCGNSFNNWLGPIIGDIARQAGLTAHELVGTEYIGGSSVAQHWEAPTESSPVKRALVAGSVDVLALTPIWLPDDGIEKFAEFAIARNPNVRIIVQASWVPRDVYRPVYPLDVKSFVDHNALPLPELRQNNDAYRRDIERVVAAVNQRLGRQVVFVVPVGDATVALREAIVAGKAEPLRVQWALFRDFWGHPTAPLKVLAAYCHYAVIYRRSPVGLPLPQELLRNRDFAAPALNRLLQEVAWAAVQGCPAAGVSAPAAK